MRDYIQRELIRSKLLRDYAGAVHDYTQLIQWKPSLAVARVGFAYLQRGKIRHAQLNYRQAALEDFNQALKLYSQFSEAYSGRGIIRLDSGDIQGAIDDFTRAIQTNANLSNRLRKSCKSVFSSRQLAERSERLSSSSIALSKAEESKRLLHCI